MLAVTAAPAAQAISMDGFVSGMGIGFDAVLVRPMRAIGVLVGAGFFIPAAIITAPGGRPAIEQAYDKLIATPWELAFQRPLGEF